MHSRMAINSEILKGMAKDYNSVIMMVTNSGLGLLRLRPTNLVRKKDYNLAKLKHYSSVIKIH